MENLGPFSSSTLDFLRDVGRRISHISGGDREVLFLFQRISVTIQRFNSVLLHDSVSIDRPYHYSLRWFYLLFLTLGIFTTKGIKNNNNNKMIFKEHGVCPMLSLTLFKIFPSKSSAWPWHLGSRELVYLQSFRDNEPAAEALTDNSITVWCLSRCSVRESAGLIRSDSKRPDGATLIPLAKVKLMPWDVNVPAAEQGAAAQQAAINKTAKYLKNCKEVFFLVAIETAGWWNQQAIWLVQEIGRRTTVIIEDSRETAFLFQDCPWLGRREIRSHSWALFRNISQSLQSFTPFVNF